MRKITIFLMTVIMLFGIVPSAAANENKEFELPVEGATGYADLTLLASEWWHFNDLDSYRSTGNAGSGNFSTEKVLSIAP